MSIPDSKWLEILKASGWQTAAIAAACGVFLLMDHWGWLPPLEPWMTLLATFFLLLCGFLACASFFSSLFRFFPIQIWFVHWLNIYRAKSDLRDYIQYMTPTERKIIAYLLAKNQKTFSAESDGGYASTLLSRGFVTIIAKPAQHISMNDVPMAIPDHLWDVLQKHKSDFPYTPPERGKTEVHPWRVPWQAR